MKIPFLKKRRIFAINHLTKDYFSDSAFSKIVMIAEYHSSENMLPKFQMYENVDRQAAVSIKTKSCIWHGDW